MAVVISLGLSLGAWTGCVTERAAGPPIQGRSAGAAIEEINLLAIPVAVNLDQTPGLDGFVIKVYASNRDRPKPVQIEDGALDIFMFDGILGVTTTASSEPLRTWHYTAAEIGEFEIKSSIGTGYQFALLWGGAEPPGSKISVVVRYTPARGTPVVSAPSIISVALK